MTDEQELMEKDETNEKDEKEDEYHNYDIMIPAATFGESISKKIESPTTTIPKPDPPVLSSDMFGFGLYAFQWEGVLCQSFCGHITIIARSLEEARENYDKFLKEYAEDHGSVELDYLGDLPIGESCSAVLTKEPDSIMDLTFIIPNGKALIIGCIGSS